MDSVEETSDGREDKKSKYFVYVLSILSTVGGFLFGYDTGVVSGAMLLITEEFHLSNVWHEAIVSAAVGAALVFALVGGWTAGSFGRKPTILAASGFFVAGSVVMAASNTKNVLLIGRCVVGAGIGLASMSVPVYIAECAPSHKRGFLVTIYQVLITLGFFASGIVCALLANVYEGWRLPWRLLMFVKRYMLGLAAVPAGIQFVGFLFMPESPRWLLSRHRYADARKALLSVHGSSKVVKMEMESIRAACDKEERLAEESKRSSGPWDLAVRVLTTPSASRPLFVGCVTQVFQQLSGINTVMYYTASIIRMSGVHKDSTAIWCAAAVSGVNFVFSFLGMYLVERAGRRTLLLWSLMGVAISSILLGVGFTIVRTNSPAVTQVGNNDHCGTMTSCQSCVSANGCGYCFERDSTGALNLSSCWAVDKQYSPAAGPCYGAGENSDYIWASDWCPSAYFWVPILAMCLYLISYAPGLGPMAWTINSEIHPLWARNFSTSIATSVNWCFNLIISMTFLSLIDAVGQSGTFYLYAGISLVGFIILWLLLPETRGLSLEDIHQQFTGSWFVFRRKRALHHEDDVKIDGFMPGGFDEAFTTHM